MNIARRHRERELAKQAARARANPTLPSIPPVEGEAEGGADDVDPSSAASLAFHLSLAGNAGASLAQVMLVKLSEDRRRLKEIQSVESKIEVKRTQILPDYDAWLEGIMAVKDELPDGEPQDVLTTLMMWHFDVGYIHAALNMAEVVLAKGIPLPSQFNRTPATAIAEEVAEGVFAAIRAKAEPDMLLAWSEWVHRTQGLTETLDMPDQVRAKLFKAAALIMEALFDRMAAEGETPDGVAGALLTAATDGLAPAQRALELDPKSGVKGIIAKFERALKRTPSQDAETTDAPAAGSTAATAATAQNGEA